MKIHQLKIEKQHYDDLMSGKKKAELRFDDRDYQVGDIIHFKGFALSDGNVKPIVFEDRALKLFYITHCVNSVRYLQPGYVMLSVEPIIISSYEYNGQINLLYPFSILRDIFIACEKNNKVIKEFIKTVNWVVKTI